MIVAELLFEIGQSLLGFFQFNQRVSLDISQAGERYELDRRLFPAVEMLLNNEPPR